MDRSPTQPDFRFTSLEEVLSRTDLTSPQKAELLRGWQQDAMQLAVAEQEGMRTIDEEDILLRPIMLAVQRLNVEIAAHSA